MTSFLDQFIRSYFNVVNLIEKDLSEQAAAEIRELRREIESKSEIKSLSSQIDLSSAQILVVLLSTRIAVKSGHSALPLENLNMTSIKDLFLLGEINLVRGLACYYKKDFLKGASYFLSASEYFIQTPFSERSYICHYNYLIGLTYDKEKSSHWLLTEFRKLESRLLDQSPASQNKKTLGLIKRQKSYFYKEIGHFRAAKEEGLIAAQWLECYGSQSDYHLSLLNLVDIDLAMKQMDLAQQHLEKVLEPIDLRVRFPYQYFQHRLLDKPLSLDSVTYSCSHFLERYQEWKNQTESERATETVDATESMDAVSWKQQSGELTYKGKVFRFRPHSLEKKLISFLFKKPVSKQTLIERLWPEVVSLAALDNRLHRLISRLNKKTGGVIGFVNNRYVIE